MKKTLCHITWINANYSQLHIVFCLLVNVELLWIKLYLIRFNSSDIVNTVNVNYQVSCFQIYLN